MLYLIGLGLYDEKDLSLKGLEVLKASDMVYAELYTSFFGGDLGKLEELSVKKITVLSRADVEEHPGGNVLKDAKEKTVSFLVCGDPLVATTHADLIVRARKLGIATKIIHSSSIYSAIGESGLQLYKFGKTTTLAYPEQGYKPTSPYEVIAENKKRGLHTLVLLDVKAEEDRYMTVAEGVKLLLGNGVVSSNIKLVGCARLGEDSKIVYSTAEKLAETDFGGPPHAILVPGELHFMEEEMLEAL
ncbi:MAG: diphthine synthase [Methanobacteriota archaeon]